MAKINYSLPMTYYTCLYRSVLLMLLMGLACHGAVAQSTAQPIALPRIAFEFASAEDGAQVLGANDEYVQTTGAMERMAKTRSATPVSPEVFMRYMRATAQDWTATDRARVEAELPALAAFIQPIVWSKPSVIRFVRASAALEDDLPHTRGLAVVLPDSVFGMPRAAFASMLAHEVFHILTRHNPQFKERAYQLVGFERCDSMRISPQIDQLKITNPDTPVSQHTIAVRYQSRPVHALPFIGFASAAADTTRGFINQLEVNWLLVQRANGHCTLDAASLAGHSAPPEALEGLTDKIGKNTGYLFHAEEILAENFAALFSISTGAKQLANYPSPQVLLGLRALLSQGP